MLVIPTQHLEPLTPLVGCWRTSGAVFDEHGNTQTHLAGTDVYDWLPGGHWIAHDVDVTMGGQRVLVHELIGGVHPPEAGRCMRSTLPTAQESCA